MSKRFQREYLNGKLLHSVTNNFIWRRTVPRDIYLINAIFRNPLVMTPSNTKHRLYSKKSQKLESFLFSARVQDRENNYKSRGKNTPSGHFCATCTFYSPRCYFEFMRKFFGYHFHSLFQLRNNQTTTISQSMFSLFECFFAEGYVLLPLSQTPTGS